MNGAQIAVTVVYTICGLLIIGIGISLYLLFRVFPHRKHGRDGKAGQVLFSGFTHLRGVEITTDPTPGKYLTPCSVQLLCSPYAHAAAFSAPTGTKPVVDVLLYVEEVPLSNTAHPDGAFRVLGSEASLYHSDFSLYTAPLLFDHQGRFIIRAYTVCTARKEVGMVHQFIFDIVQSASNGAQGTRPLSVEPVRQEEPCGWEDRRDGWPKPALAPPAISTAAGAVSAAPVASPEATSVVPLLAGPLPSLRPPSHPSGATTAAVGPYANLPPRIHPSRGEITSNTPIQIQPHEQSTTIQHLLYSIDGSYPSVPYTGPFLIPYSGRERQPVVVRSVAIASPSSGPRTRGIYSAVTEAELLVCRVAHSFLDHSIPAPSLTMHAVDASLYFDLDAVGAAVGGASVEVYYLIYKEDQRGRTEAPAFHPSIATRYKGRAVPLANNVATIYAWSVVGLQFSACKCYDAIKGAHRAVRTSTAAETVRTSAGTYVQTLSLPSPVFSVSCAELEVGFDEPPANGLLAYTMNASEPLLNDVDPPACAAAPSLLVGGGAAGAHGTRPQAALLSVNTDAVRFVHAASMNQITSDPNSSGAGGCLTSSEAPGEESLPPDTNGLHTFLYKSGQRIRVPFVDADGLYITARIFLPVYANAAGAGDSSSRDQRGGVTTNASAGPKVGYRMSPAFCRGFHFQDNPRYVKVNQNY